MADSDVTITAGAGTKIDTRTVGPSVDEHRQVIVVGDPTTNTGVAPVSATAGLSVDVFIDASTSAAANNNRLGKHEDTAHTDTDVGVMMLGVREHYSGSNTPGDYAAISVGPYGDMNSLARRDLIKVTAQLSGLNSPAATAHTAGDQFGSLLTFSSVVRVQSLTGTIVAAEVIDAEDKIGALDLVLFSSTTGLTFAGNNNAFSITLTTAPSDANRIIGVVQLGGAYDIGGQRIVQAQNIAMPFVCASGVSDIYGMLINRTNVASAYTNSDYVYVNLYIERN